VPPFDPLNWDFRVFGLVERELRFSWQEFQSLPRTTVTSDMHCVARWSALDLEFEGVAARHLLELAGVKPDAAYVMLHADGEYTANLPLDVVAGEDVVLALMQAGEPLTPEHGFPLRIIVPRRYGWKSTKWVRGIELMADDRAGFWEQHGYHMNADFANEERFGDEPRSSTVKPAPI
jgi:DMSO/TMAO reductase YedYZ molybdopterin-dependent catalytic subunit